MYSESVKKDLPIIVFADGACSGNPGPGGWACIIAIPKNGAYHSVLELGGASEDTTNNKMEITAVGKALRALEKVPGPVKIHSDSKYVIEGITKWIDGWKAKHWKKADGKEVANQAFWKRLDALVESRGRDSVTWEYVPGHSGVPGNERCDEIAVAFCQGRDAYLYDGSFDDYSVDLFAKK